MLIVHLYLTFAPLITRNINSKVKWTTSRQSKKLMDATNQSRQPPKLVRAIGSASIATISTFPSGRSAIDAKHRPENKTRYHPPFHIITIQNSTPIYHFPQVNIKIPPILRPQPTHKCSISPAHPSRTRRIKPHPNTRRTCPVSPLSSRSTTPAN
jgi:hypothetical protein